MPTPKFTPDILAAAIAGFEQQKHRIDSQIAELRAMMTDGQTEPAAAPASDRIVKRKVSAATRKRISDAQRKRWLASKKPAEPPSPKLADTKKPKRRLSAAGRRNIVEATKRRWALKRAAEAKTPVAVAKKAPATPAVKTAVKKTVPKA